MNENERPLWMPVGSVRSLLALAVVLAFTDAGSDLTKLIVGGWLATVGTVTKDYFTMRQGDGS